MPREKQLTDVSVQLQSPELDAELVPSNNLDDFTHSNNDGEKTMTQKFDFASLIAAEKQLSLDDLAEYQVVLREIAQHKCERPKAEILRLLERCDRDTSDLQADVEWRVKRDEQIAELKRTDEYRVRNDELLAELKSMREEFEKVEADYHEKRGPLVRESNSLDDKLRNNSYYRDDLYNSYRDTHLKLELQVLEDSLDRYTEGTVFKRQGQITSEIKDLEYEIAQKKITIGRDEQKAAWKRRIKELQEEWEKLELTKAEIAQKKIEHQKAVDAIKEKMIFS